MATCDAGWESASERAPGAPKTRGWSPLRVWGVAERFAAAGALAAVCPLVAICAGAVAAASGRSPFVAHQRVRRNGRPFWMWKLRTMWDASPAHGPVRLVEYLEDPYVPADKRAADPRVTHALGHWLRRYSLDELPQLAHVLTGEMSLVGPRPITRRELADHYGAHAREVLSVNPGISGLWQISGRNRLTYSQRKAYDLQYVRTRSALGDLRILLFTIPAIARKPEAR